MGYIIGSPAKNEIIAGKLYEMYDCMLVHHAPCAARLCSHCYEDKDLYKACPTCGARLPNRAGVTKCKCGAILYICIVNLTLIVTKYITPYEQFKTDDDII